MEDHIKSQDREERIQQNNWMGILAMAHAMSKGGGTQDKNEEEQFNIMVVREM